MKQLRDIGEDALIERLVKNLDQGDEVLIGPGDDCAVVDVGLEDRYQLLKTDSLVEGVHYLPTTSPSQVGWKAIARVISDFAAMGGTAGQLLVTIAMPPELEVRYVTGLYRGMEKCAKQFGASICGGETSSVPSGSAAVISIAGTGWVPKKHLVRRGGGKVDDMVLVTGKLGGSIRGKHLKFTPRVEEARWLTVNFSLHSMMDLSDGLARDLPRLAKASGCSYVIDEASVPRNRGCDVASALEDGEDFELLLTVSKQLAPSLLTAWAEQFPNLQLTAVGRLTAGKLGKARGGWEHFRR